MIDFDKIIFCGRCGEVPAPALHLHAFSRPASLWQGGEVLKTAAGPETAETGLD
jgi:hypothetical protein